MDLGQRREVVHHVVAEEAEVHRILLLAGCRTPPFAGEVLHLFGSAEAYRRGVDRQRPLDAASAAFAHAAPVLERVAHQRIGRDGRDGLVEILHLDRRQRDLDDISVGAVFRHGDPVSRAQHVVGRELYAGHQPEDAVAEDEHQHGGRGAESGQNRRGVAADEDADDEDAADQHRDELDHLVDSLERAVAERLVFVRNVVQGVQNG